MRLTISFYLFVAFAYQISLSILVTNAISVQENLLDSFSNEEMMEYNLENAPMANGLLIEYSDLLDSSSDSPLDETTSLSVETSPSSDETSLSSEETSPSSDETSPSSDETSPSSDETSLSSDETSPSSDETSPSSDETSPSSDETSPSSDETSPSSDETSPSSDETSLSSDETSPSSDETSPSSDETSSSSDETSPSSDETSPSSDETSPSSDETSPSSDETSSSSDESSQSTESTSSTPTPTPAPCDSSKSLTSNGCNYTNYERCDNTSKTCVCNAGYAQPLSSTACIAVDEIEVAATLNQTSQNSVNRRYRREDASDCNEDVKQTISDDILNSLEVDYQDLIVDDGSTIQQCTIADSGILTVKALLKFKSNSISDQQIEDIPSTISDNWSDSSYAVDVSSANAVYTTCPETYCDSNAVCNANATQNAYCSCKPSYQDFTPSGLSGQICLNCDCNDHGTCVFTGDFKFDHCSCVEPYFPDSNCGYNKNVVIGGSVAGGVVLIIIIIVTTVCCCKKSKKSKVKVSKENLIEEDSELQLNFHIPRARV